ncbi:MULTISPECIES: hypothetical protein [unclassified Methylobacterium]|uniref:hypothetical protein n=1 Tax=unclassified Methylobacterium TaxID=2615210 RepID=UPI001FEDDA25|nr:MULTISPECIES: hypothetical protein [unclassified Methylobacterium]
MLDHMDGDTDLEDGADDEPALAAPENTTGSQIVWMRGSDRNGETETAEILLSECGIKRDSDPFVLPGNGHGNVIAACGSVSPNLVGGRK